MMRLQVLARHLHPEPGSSDVLAANVSLPTLVTLQTNPTPPHPTPCIYHQQLQDCAANSTLAFARCEPPLDVAFSRPALEVCVLHSFFIHTQTSHSTLYSLLCTATSLC